ncbi:hypothetical protein SAMN05444143_105184 [Flavobacterium succinicans]|uniref:Uncharacterized protein n=1 Tax=Flavobacterium succinicans TaxID=29536 RepID=A0A1I4VU98_9FLAO|nr:MULTISPECIES: hypothetical protein [Flavobacterium]SFN04871.1 hypothetical protein SAMN05444143_105184 [Flavobacterium succinicans]
MKYLKFTSYAYLVIALICVYDGVKKWNDPTSGPWLSLGIAVVAVFMFFFRTKYAKRFEDRDAQK